MNTFKVFLAGLSLDFTEDELFDFFSDQYDSIVSIQLVKQTYTTTKTPNKGSAFMKLTDLAEVMDLLRREKFSFKGRNFLAKKYKEGAELERFKKELASRRIFVHKIGPELTNEHLISFFSQIVDIEDAYIINPERKDTQRVSQGRRFYHLGSKPLSKRRFRYGYLVLKHAEDAKYLLMRRTFHIKNSYVFLEKYRTPKQNNNSHSNQRQYEFNSTKFRRKLNPKNRTKNGQNFVQPNLRGRMSLSMMTTMMGIGDRAQTIETLSEARETLLVIYQNHDCGSREAQIYEERHNYRTNQHHQSSTQRTNQQQFDSGRANQQICKNYDQGQNWKYLDEFQGRKNHWRRYPSRRANNNLQNTFCNYLEQKNLKSRKKLNPVQNYLALLQDQNSNSKFSIRGSNQQNGGTKLIRTNKNSLTTNSFNHEKRLKTYRLDLPKGHDDLFNNFLATSKAEGNHLLPNIEFSNTEF